jgi:DnaJ like chaperone protein
MSIWSQLSSLARKAFEPDDETGTDVAAVTCAPDPGDVEFTAAIIGLSAKLAKADGMVTTEEVAAFARVFTVAPEDEAAMRRVFNIARQTVLGYETYARRIAKRYRERQCLLEGVLDGLFRIAASDGTITAEELDYLHSVAGLFGFTEDQFRRIKASHLGPDGDDPYLVLGVRHDATFEEVRAAYRKLMLENHPDTMAGSKSAPREFEPVAHEKSAAITTAYARIRSERGILTRAD